MDKNKKQKSESKEHKLLMVKAGIRSIIEKKKKEKENLGLLSLAIKKNNPEKIKEYAIRLCKIDNKKEN
jgi:predicted regulator of Ras-like GTPase activity (Roadblock/LC7/MglB family)